LHVKQTNNMKKFHLPKPKELTLECPICGNEMELTEVPIALWVRKKNKIVYGWLLGYECDKCDKRYTTTESDTISHSHFKTIQLPKSKKKEKIC